MKYFLDTKFIETNNAVDLISITILSEDGRKLYYQNAECDFTKADEWTKVNVLDRLDGDWQTQTGSDRWKSKSVIAAMILNFVGWSPDTGFASKGIPEFLADYDINDPRYSNYLQNLLQTFIHNREYKLCIN